MSLSSNLNMTVAFLPASTDPMTSQQLAQDSIKHWHMLKKWTYLWRKLQLTSLKMALKSTILLCTIGKIRLQCFLSAWFFKKVNNVTFNFVCV